jgi:hypothetical protein
VQHYFSWQLTQPDRFGNLSLFNAGSSTAYNVRVEPDNSARIEPRSFYQNEIAANNTSDRLKVVREGAAKYPSIRIIWSDKDRNAHSVVLEVKI